MNSKQYSLVILWLLGLSCGLQASQKFYPGTDQQFGILNRYEEEEEGDWEDGASTTSLENADRTLYMGAKRQLLSNARINPDESDLSDDEGDAELLHTTLLGTPNSNRTDDSRDCRVLGLDPRSGRLTRVIPSPSTPLLTDEDGDDEAPEGAGACRRFITAPFSLFCYCIGCSEFN